MQIKQAPRGIYLRLQCMHSPAAKNIYNDLRRREAWGGKKETRHTTDEEEAGNEHRGAFLLDPSARMCLAQRVTTMA